MEGRLSQRNALLERIALRLEIARQSRCDVALAALGRLEEPAISSLALQVRAEMPRLVHTKKFFQHLIDETKAAHDHGASMRRSTLNRALRRHYWSMLRIIRDSHREVDDHLWQVEQNNHADLQRTLDEQLQGLVAVRMRYVDPYTSCSVSRAVEYHLEAAMLKQANSSKDETYMTTLNSFEKNAWHEAASMVLRWKIKQHAAYGGRMHTATATLANKYGSGILGLQTVAVALHEAAGAIRPLIYMDGQVGGWMNGPVNR